VDEIFRGKSQGFIPTIVLAEFALAEEKRRSRVQFSQLLDLLSTRPTIHIVSLDLAIVDRARALTTIPDLHDRFIAATALELDALLVTFDRAITASQVVPVVW
jgi:predicted nucleic acid-binding protein